MSLSSTHAEPGGVERRIRVAFDLLRAGRLEEAVALSRSLEQAAPSVPVSLLACEIAEARSGATEALEVVTAALARLGEQAALLLKRAHLLVALRRLPEAFAATNRAAELGASDPGLLQAVATIHLQHGDPADAKPLLLRASALLPQNPSVLYLTALCHFYLNEMDAAGGLLDRVLRLEPGRGPALHVRSQLRTQTRGSNNVDDLRRVLSRPNLRPGDAMLANFALAKELEDVGEFAGSFEALREANRLKRSTLHYSVQDDVRTMQEMMTAYSKEALDRITDGDPTAGPIFIVGMPRSGTTLVERILASHSDVASLGEAVDFPILMAALARSVQERAGPPQQDLLHASLQMDFAELGRTYLAAVRPRAKGRAWTVDKLPFNFRYCGLIHKALPNAKILHLTRDPMDTCYAVFKTLFVNSYHFSYQLDELAEFYVAYRRTMDHWHAVLPGVIHDVSYEELVADPPAQCRTLLKWCGLPWQEGVLEFHRTATASTTASAAQVRKPIYKSSVAKWRSVTTQMQPVLRRLNAAGLVDEYGNATLACRTC